MYGLIALCLAYVYSQFARSFLAVLTPVLSQDLAMTNTEFGYASGLWFIAFAVFQFPVGYLLDTIGPKKTAGFVFTLFAGAGFIVFASASGPLMIIVAMGLIGCGCSTALMAPMYIFVREYDQRQFAILVSVFIAIGSLGNIFSSEPLAAAVELWGWRQSALALGIGVFIVGAAIFLTVKDPEKLDQSERSGGLLDLLKIRELWLVFPIILGGYVVTAGLRGSWIGPFHSELYNFDTLEVGRATLFMSIAMVAGTLFYGPLDRILNSRKQVIMGGNLITLALCIFMAVNLPQTPWVGTLIFVLLGFFGTSYAVQMAHGKSFIPEHLAGRGVTLLNFFAIGGAGLFQWLSGPVIDGFAVPGSAQSTYETLFIYYVVVTAIAIIPYAFSKDAKPADKA